MKKIFLVAVAAVMALAVFTGCNNEIDSVKEGAVLGWSTVDNEVLTSAWNNGQAVKVDATVSANGFLRIQDNWWVYTDTSAYTDEDLTTEADFSNGYDGTLYFYTPDVGKDKGSICFCGNDVTIWTETIKAYDVATLDSLQGKIDDLETEIEDLKEQVANGSSSSSSNSGSSSSSSNSGSSSSSSKTQPTLTSVTSAALVKNTDGNNNQKVLTVLDSTNEYIATDGDTVTVTFTAVADKAPNSDVELKAFLVDASANAGWWNVLSNYVASEKISTTSTNYSFKFTISGNAYSKDPADCQLGLYFDKIQDDTVTLTISNFKMTVE